jgi:hypothetical protein
MFGASMMAVPWDARLTVVDVAPIEGTLRGVPLSATKFTGNETVAAPVFVK